MIKKYKNYILTIYLIILLIIIYFFLIYKVTPTSNWLPNNNLIGHAISGIDNQDYTNSLEALELATKNDINVIEVDLLFTSDKKIVLNHYWENNKVNSYKEFMNKKIKNKYTPMDIDNLFTYMINNKNLYVIIDTKENEYSNKKIKLYKEIVSICQKKYKEILDRLIIQIYEYKDYNKIKEIYPFKNYIFSIYKLKKKNIFNTTYFCLFNNIDTIAIPKEYIDNKKITKQIIKYIKSKNIKIYTYTVNDKKDYKNYLKKGINGVYTDYLNMK